MVPSFQSTSSRILSALVILLLIFLVIAAIAVAVALGVISSLPDGVFALITQSPLVTQRAAILSTGSGRLAFGAVTLESVVVTGIVLVTLLQLLRSTRATPFIAANVARLRLIAGAYAVSLISRFTVPLIVPAAVAHWLAATHWSFDVSGAAALLIALVLAEVFREGVRLREDHDATV